ncbi:MAG: S41 family peptidase [Ferruginibacter sp.]
MKVFVSLILLPVLLLSCIIDTKKEKDVFAVTIEPGKLKEDIDVLKKIFQSTHAGAYAYNTPAELDGFIDSVASTINEPLNLIRFYSKVNAAVDRIHCLHTAAYFNDDLMDSLRNRNAFFPIPLIAVNNKIYVNSEDWDIPLGSEIISVNNHFSKELISKLSPYAHTDGFSNKAKDCSIDDDFAYNYFMEYGPGDQFIIRYRDQKSGKGEAGTVTAKRLRDIYKDDYYKTYFFYPSDVSYDFEILDKSKAAVLTVRTFDYDTYNSTSAFTHFTDNSFRMLRQNNINNLVIDLRNNSGGYYRDTYYLLSHLVQDELPEFDSVTKRFDYLPYVDYVDRDDSSKMKAENAERSEFMQLQKDCYTQKNEFIPKCKPALPVYKGNVYLLINKRVASAASTFASILKGKANVMLVGEETAGDNAAHNSSVITYLLPNSGIKVSIPTKRYYQPAKGVKPGTGVTPDKYIIPTLEDIMGNEDAPMNYVLDSLIRK